MVHSQFESCINVLARRGSLNVGYEFGMKEEFDRPNLFEAHDRLKYNNTSIVSHCVSLELTSLMNGINRAFETKPGTSFEVVTSLTLR
jgi:hypothetical protein